ncbi:MAG: ketopantoate reductase family protein [Desulfitobacteriaceae bacterium]
MNEKLVKPEITVVGTGAIGGVLAAYLARNGERVTCVDVAEEHVLTMNDKGLTIEGPEETFTVSVRALTPEQLLAVGKPLEMVFLCVKAQHTPEALKSIIPLLQPSSAVVSFQNGLNEEYIREKIGDERTIGCFVNFSADYLSPGRILYGGVSALYLGELDGQISERISNLQQRLACWGPVQLTDNIWGYLWGKMGYAALLYATALVDDTMAAVVYRADLRETLMALCTESLTIADRLGITPEGFDDWTPHLVYPLETRDWETLNVQLDRLAHRMATNKKTKSGIWRDLAVRKRKTEVDFQLGKVVEMGHQLEIPVPLTSLVVKMIKELEEGTRFMNWANLEELKKC